MKNNNSGFCLTILQFANTKWNGQQRQPHATNDVESELMPWYRNFLLLDTIEWVIHFRCSDVVDVVDG